jgi:hypothetical protein
MSDFDPEISQILNGRPKHHGERLLGVAGALLPKLCLFCQEIKAT